MGAGPVDGAAAGAGDGGFTATAAATPVRLAIGDFSFLFFRMPFLGCAVSGAGAYGPEPSAAVPLCQSEAAHGDLVRPLSGVWAAIVKGLFGTADTCCECDLRRHSDNTPTLVAPSRPHAPLAVSFGACCPCPQRLSLLRSLRCAHCDA